MASRIRVGLVGCGWISRLAHIPNLVANAHAEVVALCDATDSARAHAMRMFPSAAAYRDGPLLMSDPEVDAVLIAVPPTSAADLAIAAFEAGKHVYLEKPGAISFTEGETIRAAWKASGKVGTVGYNFRRHTALADAHRRVRTGEIGDLVSITGLFTWSGGETNGWRADPRSGGAMVDLASHHLDLAHWFVGAEAETTDGRIRSVAQPNDTSDVFVGFEDGATATIHVSSAQGRNANRISLLGRAGHIDIDLTQPDPVRVLRGDPPRGRLARLRSKIVGFAPATLVASGAEPSFALLLDDFLKACGGGEAGAPDLNDGLAVLKCLDQLHRSDPGRGGALAIR